MKAINARSYLSSMGVGHDEQTYCRIAPDSCNAMYADQRYQDHNPIPCQAGFRHEPVKWFALKWRTPGELSVQSVMRDIRCPDGLAVPCHGPHNQFGVVSLAFERLDQGAPAEQRATELAAAALHSRMRALAPSRAGAVSPSLTVRKRDCLAFIAEGRSDPEIAALLNVSRPTVATHVSNARAKLCARTRSQAVAIYFASHAGL